MGSAGDRCVCPLYHVFSSTQSSSLCFHMHVSTNVVPPPSLHYISLDALSLFSEPLLPIRVSVCRSSPAVPSLPEGSKLQNKWPCFLTTQARDAEVLLDSPSLQSRTKPWYICWPHPVFSSLQPQLSPGLRSPGSASGSLSSLVLPSPPCGTWPSAQS